jgi:hypothetical protein
MKVNDSFYASAGDLVHVVTMASALSFAALAGTYMKDENSTLFDPQWKEDGFCVTNAEVPFWSSHDMCLYVDTVFALGLTVLYLAWRNDPGMTAANLLMKTGIPGILLHGVGHGGISKAYRDGRIGGEESQKSAFTNAWENHETMVDSAVAFAVNFLPLLLFWLALSKSSLPNMPNPRVAVAAIFAFVIHLLIPQHFGFSYVQTILMVEFALNQLSRDKKEKDFTYFLYPTLVALPLTIVGWLESTMCSKFVQDYFYGHLAYDIYIPVSMIVWYTIVHNTEAGKQDKIKKL